MSREITHERETYGKYCMDISELLKGLEQIAESIKNDIKEAKNMCSQVLYPNKNKEKDELRQALDDLY